MESMTSMHENFSSNRSSYYTMVNNDMNMLKFINNFVVLGQKMRKQNETINLPVF